MAINKVKINSDIELKDRLVAINRVTKVTKGGRTFTFSAIVVVGNENGTLKSESIVKAEIAKLVYEPSSSKFVGEVGQRREFMLKVVRAIPIDSYYGGTIYTFEDEDKNVFIWKHN